ncbi:RING-H2 finger protein atl47 [Phtheirospermum japonicum]|uniref:RING-H2 finger protein atl47 n=1 Tax=Phtheirospermum japonicum TaxID=374723 RepID=A0A830CVU7_9LAMI|nr:RING-H2 finger protein atl47 [Phtheirospermum japonicum]
MIIIPMNARSVCAVLVQGTKSGRLKIAGMFFTAPVWKGGLGMATGLVHSVEII